MSTDTEPKVSIILPTYNGDKFLERAISTCLNQTYKNLELILVIDGSTDKTLEILRSFSDKRLRFINNGDNLGLIESLNIGFRFASGDYLTWTSDDNFYLDHAIETLANALIQKSHIGFVYSNYTVIDDNQNFIKEGKVRPSKYLDIDNYIGACFMFRREVYAKIGQFNKDAFLVEDYEYWLRVRQHFKMEMIRDVLYKYTARNDSITGLHNIDAIQLQVETIRENFISEWKKDFYRGKKCFYSCDYQDSKNYLIKSLLKHPINLEAIRLLTLMYLNPTIVKNIRMLKKRLKKN